MTASGQRDPAEAIAGVAISGWQRLLRIHHHRLKRADLEDCLSQATLELLAAAARGQRFADTDAIRAALHQRFQSRIIDRQRARGGRSPITASLHHATAPGHGHRHGRDHRRRSARARPRARTAQESRQRHRPVDGRSAARPALPTRRPRASRAVLRTPRLERREIPQDRAARPRETTPSRPLTAPRPTLRQRYGRRRPPNPAPPDHGGSTSARPASACASPALHSSAWPSISAGLLRSSATR